MVVDKLALGPEGPICENGNFYHVEWERSELTKWDGETISTVHPLDGCGHDGLAVTAQDTFPVACLFSSDVLELDREGNELRRWNADSSGTNFISPNDFSVAADGGIHMTVFGPWDAVPRKLVGTVVYLAPGSDEWVVVADDLHFPNGLALTPDGNTLYVVETAGNRIIRFGVGEDGSLSNRESFVFLHLLDGTTPGDMWLGPDGIKVDSAGNLYAAQYPGGKMHKVDSDGNLLHFFTFSGDGGTSVSFGETEETRFVTYVIDLMNPWSGKAIPIDNVNQSEVSESRSARGLSACDTTRTVGHARNACPLSADECARPVRDRVSRDRLVSDCFRHTRFQREFRRPASAPAR